MGKKLPKTVVKEMDDVRFHIVEEAKAVIQAVKFLEEVVARYETAEAELKALENPEHDTGKGGKATTEADGGDDQG